MVKIAFLDTGPLVALIDRRDYHHTWITSVFGNLDLPIVTNTAVLTEALFLLQRVNRGEEGLMKMIINEWLAIDNVFLSQKGYIFDAMRKYKNVPCSFADANLLAMFENNKNSLIISTDSDFLIYRDSNGKPLNLISPYLK